MATKATDMKKAAYVSLLTIDKYKLVKDAYYTQDEFRDGTILTPFPLEDEILFTERREVSPYPNFVKPIVDAQVRGVFAKGVEIESADPMFSQFIDNADNAGTSLVQMLMQSTTETRLQSSAYVCMENFRADDQPDSASDAVANRILPYIFIKDATQVCEQFSQVDRFGNIERITFTNGEYKDGNDTRAKYITFDMSTVSEWYERPTSTGKPQQVEISSYEHGLGIVPVVRARDNSLSVGLIRPEPKMYDIVKLGVCAFNQKSESRNIERTQGYCTLVVPTDNPDNISIGAAGLLAVPSTTTFQPNYISPNPQVGAQLEANLQATIDSIYKLAEQNGVVGVSSAKSGVALAYEFQAHNTTLMATAKIVEQTVAALARTFSAYVGREVQYTIKVPTKFDPTDTAERLALFGMILDKTQSSALKRRIEIELAQIAFPTMSPEDFAAISQEISEELTAMSAGIEDVEDEDDTDAA